MGITTQPLLSLRKFIAIPSDRKERISSAIWGFWFLASTVLFFVLRLVTTTPLLSLLTMVISSAIAIATQKFRPEYRKIVVLFSVLALSSLFFVFFALRPLGNFVVGLGITLSALASIWKFSCTIYSIFTRGSI